MAEHITLDSGQEAMVADEPFSVTYRCARCGEFADETVRHSHWDGDKWQPRRYCWDCIEASI